MMIMLCRRKVSYLIGELLRGAYFNRLIPGNRILAGQVCYVSCTLLTLQHPTLTLQISVYLF